MVTARAQKKGKHAAGDAGADAPNPMTMFWISSPLLRGKSQKCRGDCYENLAPFWAVPSTARAIDNMLLETMPFEVAGFTPAAGQKFPGLAKGVKFIVDIELKKNGNVLLKMKHDVCNFILKCEN